MILETENSFFYYYVQLWFKYSFKEDALKNKTHTISTHTNNKVQHCAQYFPNLNALTICYECESVTREWEKESKRHRM